MSTVFEKSGAPAAASAAIRNGAAMAAFVGAGIGSFAMGLIMILSETGVLSVPTLYEPAGGVTGRTTLAVVVWLIAWAVLHRRWRGREVEPRTLSWVIAILIGLGVVGTFPPLWGLL